MPALLFFSDLNLLISSSGLGNSSKVNTLSLPVKKSCSINPLPLELYAKFMSNFLAYSIACCRPCDTECLLSFASTIAMGLFAFIYKT